MERQEARSLRAALQDMDVQEEARLHAAAQAEASDLVWRHQNEGRPYDYPNAPQKYKEHLRKGSHERYQMTGGCSTTNSANGLARPRDHSSRDRNNALQASRSGSVGERTSANRTSSLTGAGGMSQGPDPSRSHTRKVHELWDSPQKKAYMSLTDPIPLAHPRKSSGSNGRKTSANSNQGLFSNPDDQIYEEPEVALERPPHANGQMPEAPRPLRVRARNSLGRVMETTPKIDKELPALVGKLSLYDIHRNPPTQTRDPNYVTNEPPAIMLDSRDEDDVDAHDHALAMKDGKEVRSQEIRSATTMRLKDRSPKLPAPTFVSDSPDRPIVSFDPSWQPKDEVSESESKRTSQKFYAGRTSDMTKSRPLSSSSKECYRKMNSVIHDHNDADSRRSDSSPDGSIPVIEVSSNPSTKQEGAFTSVIPSINVSNGPSISINALPDSQPLTPSPLSDTKTCSRPLPTPGKGPARPLPRYRLEGGTATPQTDLRPSTKMHAASCTQCGLGIAGRIVSAAGQRFHPECFACYNCGEELECVAFYPEPENKRAERNERIQMRVQGMEVEEQDGQGELEDGDPCPRFYCHLDFHELFSPRCKSCKTPIEGEIIVACGAEWHVGHFFCAQCGDVSQFLKLRGCWADTDLRQPFDASTPFVEKDGYAWCLNCHTNRFSTKCKKCRKPVTDMVLKALGSEWHTDCFCCTVSGLISLKGVPRGANLL